MFNTNTQTGTHTHNMHNKTTTTGIDTLHGLPSSTIRKPASIACVLHVSAPPGIDLRNATCPYPVWEG